MRLQPYNFGGRQGWRMDGRMLESPPRRLISFLPDGAGWELTYYPPGHSSVRESFTTLGEAVAFARNYCLSRLGQFAPNLAILARFVNPRGRSARALPSFHGLRNRDELTPEELRRAAALFKAALAGDAAALAALKDHLAETAVLPADAEFWERVREETDFLGVFNPGPVFPPPPRPRPVQGDLFDSSSTRARARKVAATGTPSLRDLVYLGSVPLAAGAEAAALPPAGQEEVVAAVKGGVPPRAAIAAAKKKYPRPAAGEPGRPAAL